MRSWCVNCPNWYPIERGKVFLLSFVWQLPFNTSSQLAWLLCTILSCSLSLLMGLVWPWLDIKELQILFGNGHFVSSYHVILDFEEPGISALFFRCSNCSLRAKLWTAMNLDSQMNAIVVLRFLLYLHSMLSSPRNNGIRSTKNQKWWLTGGGQCEKGEKSHQIAKV